jgi:shikimate kinase
MKRSNFGESHSAVSIVNAIATGKGAAIGIGLDCKIKAILIKRKSHRRVLLESNVKDRHRLIETCVEYTERFLKSKIPENSAVSLSIQSEIPYAVGLKSSSAVSIACVTAISNALNKKLDYRDILRISCLASKGSGASITGAYDDASACLLGGFVVTDNYQFKLVRHTRVPKSIGELALIRLPSGKKKYTSSVDSKVYSNLKQESMKAIDYARRSKIAQAMMMNSIVQCAALDYSFEPITFALEEGATAAGISGKGPAIAAFCQSSKIAHAIEKRWIEESLSPLEILKTKIVQPERVY